MNTEWKPIASAPKDGTRIAIKFSNGNEHQANWRATYGGEWHVDSFKYLPWADQHEITHWMPLAAAPCPTCNDQGAVGNILTAEPCPDCTPAPTSHPIPTGATGEEKDGLAEAQRLAQALFQRHFSQDDDYVSGRVKWEVLDDLPGVLSQIDNMVSGLVQPAALAAGDALDAARYRWLRDPKADPALVLDKRTGYVPEDESVPGVGGYHTYEYRAGEELDAAIDAALAAQIPQQGEA